VPAGLELDGGTDLLDREACGDGHPESAGRNQASQLFQGAGGGIGAVGRCDPVDLGGDGRDACVRDAKSPCRVRCLGSIERARLCRSATGSLTIVSRVA